MERGRNGDSNPGFRDTTPGSIRVRHDIAGLETEEMVKFVIQKPFKL